MHVFVFYCIMHGSILLSVLALFLLGAAARRFLGAGYFREIDPRRQSGIRYYH